MSIEKPIQIRLLTSNDLEQFYFTFLESFSDYSVDMHLERKAFDKRMLKKLAIDWQLCIGAFSGDKMVGFIAHTSNEFQNQYCAYNGGTGVIPAYRGLGLTGHMYALATKCMIKKGLTACILEVIDHNAYATEAYAKVGFEKGRLLRCYKLVGKPEKATLNCNVPEDLDVEKLKGLDINTQPSFMDSWNQLARNRENEKVIVIPGYDDVPVGYIVFQPDTGRIARIWIRDQDRQTGMGRSLIAAALIHSSNKSLTVINVDATDTLANQFLIACGFENQINQWEMTLRLD